jgi:predicted RNase H-like nuclease (RuvC/YqgF family)
MAIRTLVTRGYGNGTFSGTIPLTVLRGYVAGEAIEAAEENAGGWWFGYDQEIQRREEDERLRLKRLEEAKQIKDKLERELALEYRKIEAEESRKAELNRLRKLSERHSREIRDNLGERVYNVVERAVVQQNFSAMEALDREMKQIREEELFLMQALMVAINA